MGIAKFTASRSLDGQNLEALFKSVPDNTFLLIEDVDCLFVERESKDSIDLSTLLNLLDGLTSKKGLVVFMTTNHLEKLDSALIRPGRVDMIIKYHHPTLDQIKDALKVLAEDYVHEHEQFINKIKDNLSMISIAKLQQFLFDCIIEEKKSILDIGQLLE